MTHQALEESNPYRAPEASEKVGALQVAPISESRYLANFGCGVAVLMTAVPMTSMAGYRLLTGSFETIGAFVIGLLFVFGTIRSLLWARRHRPKPPGR